VAERKKGEEEPERKEWIKEVGKKKRKRKRKRKYCIHTVKEDTGGVGGKVVFVGNAD
jgi:hypothetical protein